MTDTGLLTESLQILLTVSQAKPHWFPPAERWRTVNSQLHRYERHSEAVFRHDPINDICSHALWSDLLMVVACI